MICLQCGSTKMTGTELEKKIAESCSNQPWGASTTMLSEIAQATYDYQEYPVVMSNVWKRIGERGKTWRIMYKALSLLEYLIRNGSERAVEDARDHMYQLRTLCDFQHSDGGQVCGWLFGPCAAMHAAPYFRLLLPVACAA